MRFLATALALALGLALSLPAAANCGMPGCTGGRPEKGTEHGHEHGPGHQHDHHDGATAAEATTAAPTLFTPYEAIRTLLTKDTTEGARAHATELAKAAKRLARDFDAGAAGVPASRKDEAVPLLQEIARAASALAEAKDLAASRDAFYEVSKPLVRYRGLVEGARPIVVFCPMVQRSWLQPDEPVGNPYYGSSMLRCGDVVSR